MQLFVKEIPKSCEKCKIGYKNWIDNDGTYICPIQNNLDEHTNTLYKTCPLKPITDAVEECEIIFPSSPIKVFTNFGKCTKCGRDGIYILWNGTKFVAGFEYCPNCGKKIK